MRKRPRAAPRSGRRAPSPARRSRGAARARPGPRAARPPSRPPESPEPSPPRRSSSGLRPCLSAVTCCWGRLPLHTSPGSGDGGGWSRGFHMRPPGPRASGCRRRSSPRSARVRRAGPPAGASAAPPLRLWLPKERPYFSVPRRPRPSPGHPCHRERRPSASYGRRVGPQRRGPDTVSKMAPRARGRALPGASLPPAARARRRALPGGRGLLRAGAPAPAALLPQPRAGCLPQA